MHQLGKKQLTLQLQHPLTRLPLDLEGLELSADGHVLTYTYDAQNTRLAIAELLKKLAVAGIEIKDLDTKQSSLEDIFVGLVNDGSNNA